MHVRIMILFYIREKCVIVLKLLYLHQDWYLAEILYDYFSVVIFWASIAISWYTARARRYLL